MLDKLMKLAGVQNSQTRREKLRNDLIHHEARIGGEIFGKPANGARREFFCLDETTWIWYEEWLDSRQQKQSRTTRYNVRPDGITKVLENGNQYLLSDSETLRLHHAIKIYQRKVNSRLYQAIV